MPKAAEASGDVPDGEIARYRRALAANPGNFQAHNELGILLNRCDRWQEALVEFEAALTLIPRQPACLANRGVIELKLGRAEDAVSSLRQALMFDPDMPVAWHALGTALGALALLAPAEAAYREALRRAPDQIETYLKLADLLERDHRPAEAAALHAAACTRRPLTITPCRRPVPEARILILSGAGRCNLPTPLLFDAARFETCQLALSGSPVNPAHEKLPACDVVFNAIADPDSGAHFLRHAAAVAAELGLPQLNPPARIERLRRDRVQPLLSGIPGVVVPRTRRETRARILSMTARRLRLRRPLLVRPAGDHGGDELRRFSQHADLRAYVEKLPHAHCYLTDYHDYRSADGYYRKYRFIFVDRQIYPYHLAILDDWKVHYWRTETAQESWMESEEQAFLADFEAALGSRISEAVRQVARRVDLDYGGIDCAVTESGELLVFETNAAMLVHLFAGADRSPDKQRAVRAIVDAVAAMIARHAGS